MPIRNVEIELESPSAPEGEVYEFQLAVEPYLMGGGARPREHDACGVVRPTSVLGQVRWFWRLLHADLPLEKLREKESRLFGAASQPGSFAIQVTSTSRGRQVNVPGMGQPGGYFLFAGREERRSGTPQAHLSEGVTATVRLRALDGALDDSVLRAFRLWSLLGGVGARTRRGVGAVQVSGSPGSVAELDAALRELIGNPPPHGGDVAGLEAVWVGDRTFPSAQQCFNALEDWYKAYRQDRRPGSAQNRPGRSHWDEPEEIRRLLKQRAPRHPPLPPTTRHAPGWARAVLGLPIVFHFKDAREGDPDQTMLVARDSDRMASPLLFRPVRVGRDYVAVAALLESHHDVPEELELKQGRKSHAVPLTSDPFRVYRDLLPGLGGSPANPLRLRKVI
jgi:CRISPR-associated protein Cmr1